MLETLRSAIGVALALGMATAATAEDTIVVIPKPIGATEKLLSIRSEGAPRTLPVESLAPARVEPRTVRQLDQRRQLGGTVTYEIQPVQSLPLKQGAAIQVDSKTRIDGADLGSKAELDPRLDPNRTADLLTSEQRRYPAVRTTDAKAVHWEYPRNKLGAFLHICNGKNIRCGKATADEFCRSNGLGAVENFTKFRPSVSGFLGGRGDCKDCEAFKRISCAKSAPSADRVAEEQRAFREVRTVQADTVRWEYPRNKLRAFLHICNPKDVKCGKPTADDFCQSNRLGRARTFATFVPAVSGFLGGRGDCSECKAFKRIDCAKPAPPPPEGEETEEAPAESSSDEDAELDDDGDAYEQDDDEYQSEAALALRQQREEQVYSFINDRISDLQRLREERRERLRAEEEAAKDIQGPSALGTINLLEGLHVDRQVELLPSEILQIDYQVYQDANPATGLYYFAPRRYDLGWSPEDRYALRVIYGTAQPDEEEGEVYMAARLRAGITTREIEVAERLLDAYLKRRPDSERVKFRGLRPLPVGAASEVALFGGATNQFTVSDDRISVQGLSGLLNTIDISWSTDIRRLLNIESLLRTSAGVHGAVTLHAAGKEEFTRTMPLELQVANARTFGRIGFDREAGWKNQTVYPIHLKQLHALVTAPSNQGTVREHDPLILSWDLGGQIVPPGASVSWDGEHVPGWVDQESLHFWVDYRVDDECVACTRLVFDEKFIPSRPTTFEIVFTTGDAFEATDAFRMSVEIRSPFLEPQRGQLVTQAGIPLEGDGKQAVVSRLFLTDREFKGDGVEQPFYEYRVQVTMKDGRSFKTPEWLPSRELDFLLGSANLREAFGGEFPW